MNIITAYNVVGIWQKFLGIEPTDKIINRGAEVQYQALDLTGV